MLARLGQGLARSGIHRFAALLKASSTNVDRGPDCPPSHGNCDLHTALVMVPQPHAIGRPTPPLYWHPNFKRRARPISESLHLGIGASPTNTCPTRREAALTPAQVPAGPCL